MAETADIRVWLKENRPDLWTQRGRLNQEQVEAYHAENEAEHSAEDAEQPEVAPADTPEVSPAREKPGFFPGFKKEQPAKGPAKRRAPLDSLVSAVWTVGAHVVGRNPQMTPVARCIATQAPAAGMVLDDALKGTVVDRALQPLARAGKKGEAVAAIIGPPVIVAAITMQPELYPVLKPVLREMMASYVILAGPKIRAAQKREEKLLEELGGDMSSLDAMIDSFFAPLQGYHPEETDAAYAPAAAA